MRGYRPPCVNGYCTRCGLAIDCKCGEEAPVKTKILPVTPQEAVSQKQREFPDEVIKVFNELIVENLQHGRAHILQRDAVEKIMSVMNVDKATVFAKKWLDVENLFEKFGWKVDFDKPAYNETYEANFTFTIKG